MALEKGCRLHRVYKNHRKGCGFTLLELLIAIAVMAVLISGAAPSFSNVIESSKVKQLATDIEWLLVQVKSEAVMRNTKLSVHYVRDDNHETSDMSDGKWVLVITDDATKPANIASAKATAIAMVEGNKFKNITMKAESTFVSHTIDPIRATTNKKGSYTFYKDPSKKINVIMDQRTGRVRVCSVEGDHYNYEDCQKR